MWMVAIILEINALIIMVLRVIIFKNLMLKAAAIILVFIYHYVVFTTIF